MTTTPRVERKHFAFDNAPRCGAKTKHNNGLPCRLAAMHGKKRCRVHGGASGSGGQRNNKNALKHGQTTREAKKFRKEVRLALRETKRMENGFEELDCSAYRQE
jgi:hypothetical protein